jgi:hypothetical protein
MASYRLFARVCVDLAMIFHSIEQFDRVFRLPGELIKKGLSSDPSPPLNFGLTSTPCDVVCRQTSSSVVVPLELAQAPIGAGKTRRLPISAVRAIAAPKNRAVKGRNFFTMPW